MPTARTKFETDLRSEYGASEAAIGRVCQILDLYEERRVLRTGDDVPLYDACPNCASCWSRASEGEYPDVEHAGISAPFIGGNYEERRICIVAINLRGGGGLQDVWFTSGCHINAQRAGRRGVERRPFAYAAMAYARLIDGSLSGAIPEDWHSPAPEALVATWDSCAFVEAVKCAPKTHRGQPYREMYANCPPFLLLEELALLEPQVVLLLGRGRLRDSVRPLLNIEWDSYPPEIAHPGAIERDRCEIKGRAVEVFSCFHPASLRWRESLQELHDSLKRLPLGATAGQAQSRSRSKPAPAQ